MKFILNNDKLKIQEPECKNSGSINYYLVDVEFNEEWENINIEARLTPKEGSCCDNEGRSIAVINNKLYIDNLISGYYAIGFIGFKIKYLLTQDTVINPNKTYYVRSGQEGSYIYTKVENPVVADISNYYEAIKDYQISTNLQGIFFNQGAGEIEVTNDDIPTPSQWEIYIEQIQNMIDGLESLIPTKLSQLQNDNHTVQDENYVHTDNNFTNEDKTKLDSLENYDDTEIKDDIQEINANLLNYSLITETGSKIDLEINSSTYELVAKLYDKNNNLISTSRKIDLPIESMIVRGYYDNANKKIVLILDNGNTIDIPVGDLISGLQAEITSENKLPSDLVDDTNQNNKFVTTQEKATWNGKYNKPSGGIPKADLSSEVQASLNKADTALQEHQNISGKEDKSNKVTELTSESTNEQYPSAKCVYDSQEVQNEQIIALENQIPTGEVNDTSITLTDSADYKVKEFGIEGNTEQATRSGKNYFNANAISNSNIVVSDNGKTIKMPLISSGNGITDTRSKLSALCPNLKVGDTVYLYASTTSSMNKLIYLNKSSSTWQFGQSRTITQDDLDSNVAMYGNRYNSGETEQVTITDMRIVTTQNDTWEEYGASPSPDYPSEVNNITGDVEVKVQNGNMGSPEELYHELDVNRDTTTFPPVKEVIDNRNCILMFNHIYQGKHFFEYNYKENTQYTFRFQAKKKRNDAIGDLYFTVFHTDGSSIGSHFNEQSWSEFRIVSSLNKTVQFCTFSYGGATQWAIDEDSFNIIEGDSTNYIPHQEQNYPISLGDIELCKIGDYQDYIYKENGNWYVKKYIYKKTFDSTGTITVESSSSTRTVLRFAVEPNLESYTSSSTIPNILSTHFKAAPQAATWKAGDISRAATDTANKTLFITLSNGYTGETALQWLIDNNVAIYVPLATPTTTQITDTALINQLNALEKAYTYKGVTHIDTDVETKPYLKVVYRKDIGLILERIENLEARVSLLE